MYSSYLKITRFSARLLYHDWAWKDTRENCAAGINVNVEHFMSTSIETFPSFRGYAFIRDYDKTLKRLYHDQTNKTDYRYLSWRESFAFLSCIIL